MSLPVLTLTLTLSLTMPCDENDDGEYTNLFSLLLALSPIHHPRYHPNPNPDLH